jgi:hypothetical protein
MRRDDRAGHFEHERRNTVMLQTVSISLKRCDRHSRPGRPGPHDAPSPRRPYRPIEGVGICRGGGQKPLIRAPLRPYRGNRPWPEFRDTRIAARGACAATPGRRRGKSGSRRCLPRKEAPRLRVPARDQPSADCLARAVAPQAPFGGLEMLSRRILAGLALGASLLVAGCHSASRYGGCCPTAPTVAGAAPIVVPNGGQQPCCNGNGGGIPPAPVPVPQAPPGGPFGPASVAPSNGAVPLR